MAIYSVGVEKTDIPVVVLYKKGRGVPEKFVAELELTRRMLAKDNRLEFSTLIGEFMSKYGYTTINKPLEAASVNIALKEDDLSIRNYRPETVDTFVEQYEPSMLTPLEKYGQIKVVVSTNSENPPQPATIKHSPPMYGLQLKSDHKWHSSPETILKVAREGFGMNIESDPLSTSIIFFNDSVVEQLNTADQAEFVFRVNQFISYVDRLIPIKSVFTVMFTRGKEHTEMQLMKAYDDFQNRYIAMTGHTLIDELLNFLGFTTNITIQSDEPIIYLVLAEMRESSATVLYNGLNRDYADNVPGLIASIEDEFDHAFLNNYFEEEVLHITRRTYQSNSLQDERVYDYHKKSWKKQV